MDYSELKQKALATSPLMDSNTFSIHQYYDALADVVHGLIAERNTLRTQNQALLEALKDVATSLRTISLLAGLKGSNMDSMSDVRGYARSRCVVAMTAAIKLAEGKDV